MPRWLRWIGYALCGLIGLVGVALVAIWLVTASHLDRTYRLPEAGVGAARDSAALARGRHLAEVIGKCPICHN